MGPKAFRGSARQLKHCQRPIYGHRRGIGRYQQDTRSSTLGNSRPHQDASQEARDGGSISSDQLLGERERRVEGLVGNKGSQEKADGGAEGKDCGHGSQTRQSLEVEEQGASDYPELRGVHWQSEQCHQQGKVV